MKKLLIGLSFLLLPGLALAAYDDVTLVVNVVTITAGGVDLTISGSNAVIQSITVNSDNFSVVLPTGSSIKVSSAGGYALSTDAGSSIYASNSTCSGGTSSVTLTSTASATVTVTPLSTACDAAPTTTSTGSGGGNGAPVGGGGGGGGYNPSPATPAIPTVSPAIPSPNAQPSAVALAVSPVFNRTLSPGAKHADVKRLQQILNSDPDTRVSSSGAGSPGNETTFFGGATKKAVQKFQVKYGIAKPGDTGYGNFGPKTKAKLLQLFGK